MKKFLIAGLAALSLSAIALPTDADIWTFIASDNTNGDKYSILNNSGELSKNDNGYPVIFARGRIVKADGTAEAQAWYVPLDQCKRGQGFIVVLDQQGKYLSRAQFAFHSGTIGGFLSEVMCGSAEQMLKEQAVPAQKKPTKKSTPSTAV